MIPGLSTIKLVGGLVAALILLSLVAERGRWMRRAHVAEAHEQADCAATRNASNLPKLDCNQVPQQIGFLGEAVNTLTVALHKQSDAVARLGAETEAQQKDAVQAAQEAAQRAKQPRKASDSLIASSRAPERSSAPCEPSKALEGAWK